MPSTLSCVSRMSSKNVHRGEESDQLLCWLQGNLWRRKGWEKMDEMRARLEVCATLLLHTQRSPRTPWTLVCCFIRSFCKALLDQAVLYSTRTSVWLLISSLGLHHNTRRIAKMQKGHVNRQSRMYSCRQIMQVRRTAHYGSSRHVLGSGCNGSFC